MVGGQGRVGAQGLEQFDPTRHDLVITDLRMPGIDGMQVLEQIKARSPETPVLVKADQAVAYGRVVNAMVLLQQGGAEKVGFITDPLDEPPGSASGYRALRGVP